MSSVSKIVIVAGTLFLILITYSLAIKLRNRMVSPASFLLSESILILITLNIAVWLEEPFAWNQIISWIFLIISLILAILGFTSLSIKGKPQK